MVKKVSIITPCYNGGSFVGRFFESVLAQTYSNIELIFVNDGSEDDTEKVALHYGEKLRERGLEFIYLSQANSGQAAALNAGLKIFSGSYLTWPDSDDFLTPRSIEERVFFLENSPEYGFVRTDGYIVPEDNVGKPVGYVSGKKANRFSENIFDDLILERTYLSCGCYMLRTSSFLEVNSGKKISPSRAGQNWQMLLPMAHKFDCGFIDKPLFFIVVRKGSHSRMISGKSVKIRRYEEHEKILRNVINELDVDQAYYDKLIKWKYLRRKLIIAGEYSDVALAEDCYRKLKEAGEATRGDYINYLISSNTILKHSLPIFTRVWRFFRRLHGRGGIAKS